MARQATEIRVYWDTQDRDNERWAYTASDDLGLIDSGSLDSDPDDLEAAINETICVLGMDLTADQFAAAYDEGGWAIWQAAGEGI